MDLQKYLVPVSEEQPCGEDLEDLGDMAFYELENLMPVVGELDMLNEEQDVDWVAITEKSLAQLERSKDIRTILYLAQAQLHLKGLKGFSEVIELLAKVTKEYWDTIYPMLDPDDGDPIERVNALKILGDSNSILHILKKLPIAESKGFGKISFRDCEIANGNINTVNEEDEIDSSRIHAVFMDTNKEDLEQKIVQISHLIDVLQEFDKYLLDTIPSDAPTEIKELLKLLKNILKTINEHAQNRDDWSGEGVNSNSDTDSAGVNENGTLAVSNHSSAKLIKQGITNRNDVIRSIDEICKYYENQEPSSPVPLLLQRAKRLVDKDFMEIIKDMAADAVTEISNITGVTDEEENDY